MKSHAKKGKVYLVGAGPGDPGLITSKGLKVLGSADVVIYDRLANSRLLSFARADSELIYVGKDPDTHAIDQERINRLLVEKAREGKTVVRLKGGDGFVFGRGGQEALELARNGIEYEAVPGVSSAYAVPAYAGIPVTHRGFASTVAFITGREDPDKGEARVNWEKLATAVDTLVVLMGMKNLPRIVSELVEAGRSSETPIALIRWGTTADQQTIVGTLGDIVAKVSAANFKPPAVIVVGDVVKLREELTWLEKKPLFGRRVMITRAKEQAGELVEMLEGLGAQVVEIPTIRFEAPAGWGPVDEAAGRLADYDWVVFTSANGVKFFFARLLELGLDTRSLGDCRVAAVGPATARALTEHGVKADLVSEKHQAEGVLEALQREVGGEGFTGLRVLIPRAKEAREILPDELRRRGAEAEVAPVYVTVPDDSKAAEARSLLEEGKIDILAFTSSSTASNLVGLVGVDVIRASGAKVACIGAITAETCRKLGFEPAAVAEDSTVAGLVKAISSLGG